MKQYFSQGSRWRRIDVGPTSVVGSPDLRDVRRIRIGSYAGENRSVSFFVDHLRTKPKRNKGAVVLTFDDNHISQYETAFPIMQEYGFPGVVGAIPWGTGELDFRIPVEHLTEMRDAGWDVVSHPQREKPLPDLSREAQRTAIEETKRWLLDNGFERGSRFIIWPYNGKDATTLDIARRYHVLGFGGGGHPCGAPFFAPLTVNRVKSEYLDQVKQAIDFASAYNQVVVLMFHTIGVSDDDYMTVPAFRQVMQYIEQSDVPVRSASSLWDDVVS
jgi:peptidoglycan/xylan/chitin deacetylase (PgdA/CDA1 family)